MSAQVDHDLLADYVGGALDGTPEAKRVEAFLASSPAWQNAADELTAAMRAVALDLEALGQSPETMPPDLVDRFDELLASPAMAPSPARPAVDPLAEHEPRRSVPTRTRRWRRWAAPVAIMAAAFSFFAIANLPSLTSRYDSPGSAPEAALDTDRKVTAFGGEPIPTITSGRQHNRSNLGGARTTSDTAPPASPKSESSPGQMLNMEAIPELQRLMQPAALQACLDAVALVLPGKATLVDYAYFEGKPALVISITTPSGDWMFVAGANCGLNGPDEIFKTPLK